MTQKEYKEEIEKYKKLIKNAEERLEEELNKNYKYDAEIIIRLFRTPYQTQLINDMFVEESCKRDILMQVPQPLYSEGYAGKLLHGNDDTKSIA